MFVDVINDEILEPLVFINPKCEVKVLFVEVINDDRLLPFVFIRPSCDANVLLVDVTKAEMLEPFEFINASCDESAAFEVLTTTFNADWVALLTNVSEISLTLPSGFTNDIELATMSILFVIDAPFPILFKNVIYILM